VGYGFSDKRIVTIHGKDKRGTERAARVTQTGYLGTDSPFKQKTAFGELVSAPFSVQTGWSFQYNINPALINTSTVGTGSATHVDSFAVLQTGTDSDGEAKIQTIRPVVYTPGVGSMARFTAVFDTPKEDTLQIVGIGDDANGWFFGYNGLDFGILRRSDSVDNWTYQDSWSEDTRSTLNPQTGNVYEIKYQWLGFGMQYFGIEHSTGDIEPVHQIAYSNTNIATSTRNASLPMAAQVKNTGNTTNMTLKTPSAVGGTHGAVEVPVFENLIAYENTVSIEANTETYLFGIRNPETWFTYHNHSFSRPKLFSASTDGTKNVVIRVYAEPTITGASWTDIAANVSPLQYDTVGTLTLNGEVQVFTLPMAKTDNTVVDINVLRTDIQRGQIFAVTAESTGDSDVTVGINFKSRV